MIIGNIIFFSLVISVSVCAIIVATDSIDIYTVYSHWREKTLGQILGHSAFIIVSIPVSIVWFVCILLMYLFKWISESRVLQWRPFMKRKEK